MSSPLIDVFTLPDHELCLHLNTRLWQVMETADLFEGLPRLNRHERLFLCVDIFLAELSADGLTQFFYYDGGALYAEVLQGLDELGDTRAAQLVQRYAQQVFGNEVPVNTDERQRILNNCEDEAEETQRALGDGSTIRAALAQWACAHRQHLRLPPG